MNFNELKKNNIDELKIKLKKCFYEQFNLKLKINNLNFKKTHLNKKIRHIIAYIKMLIKKKEMILYHGKKNKNC